MLTINRAPPGPAWVDRYPGTVSVVMGIISAQEPMRRIHANLERAMLDTLRWGIGAVAFKYNDAADEMFAEYVNMHAPFRL